MPKFFFIFFFLLICLPGFGQEDLEKKPLSQGGGRVIIKGGAEASPPQLDSPTPSTSSPEQPQAPSSDSISDSSNNEDSAIAELELARKKQLEKMKMIEKSVEPLKSPMLNPIDEIKKLGHKQLDFNALLDKQVLVILKEAFKDGILGHLPKEEVRKIIEDKIKHNFLGSITRLFPKVLDFLVDLSRDKHVFHGLINLVERRDDLKTYGYVWLIIFIFGLLVKRRLVKPKWTFFRRFRWNMTINFFLSLISIYVFYFMFSIELDPFVRVLTQQF
jgi:hypothetical protein